MQNFSINSVLRFKNKDYQLRTSNNGRLNKIVCSLFRNGGFINSKETEYTEHNETELLSKIKAFHEERKTEIELFFSLSEKLREEGNSELLNMLGIIFDENKLFIEAVEEFVAALEHSADDSRTFNNMGKSLLALNRFDHAVKAFEKAIRLNPDYADYYNNLGKTYLKIGACKRAVDMFELAISKNNYYAEAYFNRGIAFILNLIKKDSYELTINHKQEVRKSFEKAVLMNPSYQNAHYFNAIEKVDADKPVDALEELRAAKEDGTYFTYLHDKYNYYFKILFAENNENYDLIWEYIRFLQDLLKKYPGHADIYNDLGTAYCILRNYMNEQAITHFQNALKINPDFENARRNLKLTRYEKVGSQLFTRAITSKNKNGRLQQQQMDDKKAIKFNINDKIVNNLISNNNEEDDE